MQRISTLEMYNRLTKSKCYVDTVSLQDKNKVKKARTGINPVTPASLIAQVAAELGLRAHADEAPPVEPPPVTQPWDSGYPPLAYNSGGSPGGTEPSARYNVRINATRNSDGSYTDHHGLNYDDGGRQKGGRTEQYVPGLKHANSMDGAEPWDAYTHNGTTIGPNKESYPAACYDR